LAGLATMPCGVSEDDFAAIRTFLSSSGVEGSPGSFPAKSEVGIPEHRRSDGLSAMPGEVSNSGPRLLA
jgi:hypothetical protein